MNPASGCKGLGVGRSDYCQSVGGNGKERLVLVCEVCVKKEDFLGLKMAVHAPSTTSHLPLYVGCLLQCVELSFDLAP